MKDSCNGEGQIRGTWYVRTGRTHAVACDWIVDPWPRPSIDFHRFTYSALPAQCYHWIDWIDRSIDGRPNIGRQKHGRYSIFFPVSVTLNSVASAMFVVINLSIQNNQFKTTKSTLNSQIRFVASRQGIQPFNSSLKIWDFVGKCSQRNMFMLLDTQTDMQIHTHRQRQFSSDLTWKALAAWRLGLTIESQVDGGIFHFRLGHCQ